MAFRFIRQDGSTVVGEVHGSGGVMASRDSLHRLEAMRSKAVRGALPRPAMLRVYPSYCAEADGPCVLVDLVEVRAIERL